MSVYLARAGHVSGFRDTGLVCTDTSSVTHSKDQDGWEIGCDICSYSLLFIISSSGQCSHKTSAPPVQSRAVLAREACDGCLLYLVCISAVSGLCPIYISLGWLADRWGYLQWPREGRHPPLAASIQLWLSVRLAGSLQGVGMWEVIQLGQWRHSGNAIIWHSKYSRQDIMEILLGHWTR